MMPRIARPDPARKRSGTRSATAATACPSPPGPASGWPSASPGQDAGRDVFQLPIYDSPLEPPNLFGALRSPAFAPFRRLGQRLLYRWYARQDEAA